MCSKSHAELLSPVDYKHVRSETNALHESIASGTLDAPSWDLIRAAVMAVRWVAQGGLALRSVVSRPGRRVWIGNLMQAGQSSVGTGYL